MLNLLNLIRCPQLTVKNKRASMFSISFKCLMETLPVPFFVIVHVLCFLNLQCVDLAEPPYKHRISYYFWTHSRLVMV